MNLKDRIARTISYAWIFFVLVYVLKRMNITIAHGTFLPTASKTLIFNIGMAFCWFGILSMPSYLLLILTKEDGQGCMILKFGITLLFMIFAALLIIYFVLK